MTSRAPEQVSWGGLELAVPEVAQLGRRRFAQARLALLATLQGDGAPRISPVEPYYSGGELLFGALAWSGKARDLLGDPRCVLHSVVTAPDNGEPEFKLYGEALTAGADVRESCPDGWWNAHEVGDATVFVMRVRRATCVEWDLVEGEMVVRSWGPARGFSATRRSYP